jgi:RHS repeat-associated protein
VTYPSGKAVTYTVSNAQRLTTAKDTTSGTQFALLASYAPTGALQGMITGQVNGGFGGVTESHTYNSSLEYTSAQATSTVGTALNLSLNYSLSGGDNGTVTSITNNVDNGRTQTYAYDPLNRITSATSQATSGTDCWGQGLSPDALANLNGITPTKCTGTMLSVSVDGNNHINSSNVYAYDAAGNMTKDGTGLTYTFDAENRIVLASGMSGGPYCYVYDGNGLRVAKKSSATSCASGTVTKIYWRSISGDSLAESDGTGSTSNSAYYESVFFSGRRIASRNGTGSIFYFFADQIGTTRTITTGNGPGQTPGQLCYDADFTPYGQEMQHTERLQTTACPPNYKFTGYERDSESGLDYAIARYYSPLLGRFLATDPLGGTVGSLQSHNAYAYVLNNPLGNVDPMGLSTWGQCGDDMFGTPGQDCGNQYPLSGATGGNGVPECNTAQAQPCSIPPVITVINVTAAADDPPIPGQCYEIILDGADTGKNTCGPGGSNSSGGGGGGGGGSSNKNKGRNCSAGSASVGQYVAATAQVAALTAEFASGLGPTNQTFGPNTATSAVMAQSAAVTEVLGAYMFTGKTSGLYTFGASGAYGNGGNPVAQFLGSFR